MRTSQRTADDAAIFSVLIRYLFIFCGLLWCLAPGYSQEEPTSPKAAVAILARWIKNLQFTTQALPSYGGLKVHHTPSATGADGTLYYRVSPYISNLGVLGLLRAKMPDSLPTAQLWMGWYFAHLSEKSAPDGVPLEHFYKADGSGETTCVKPGDHALCNYNDATDSAAATFFCVLWAAHETGLPNDFFNAPGRRQQIENLAVVLLKLQQADGLCWAKNDYRAKYLEDNCEVFAGLRDLAKFERAVFRDEKRAQEYEQAALRVRAGILRELYDTDKKLYRVAKFEDGKLHDTKLTVWYADMQAQLWPHLWGVVPVNDAKSQEAVNALNTYWNGKERADWAANPSGASGWIEAGVAHAVWLAGNKVHTQIYLQNVKRLKFPTPQNVGFGWPFSISDAGWLLETFSQQNAAN